MSDGSSTPGNAVGRAVVPPVEPDKSDTTAPVDGSGPQGPARPRDGAPAGTPTARSAATPATAPPASGPRSSGSVAASVAGTGRRPAAGSATGKPTGNTAPGTSAGSGPVGSGPAGSRTRPPVSRGSATVPPARGGASTGASTGRPAGSTGLGDATRVASAAGAVRPASAPPGVRPASAPPGVRPASAPPGSARGSVGEAVRNARATVTAAAARSPRRAKLQLKRIDPWSVMKFSFAVSLVMFVVTVVATSVLYVILDGMGVFASVNDLVSNFLTSGTSDGTAGGNVNVVITAKGVIGGAALLGILNMVLFTAIATLSAFVYNVCSDLVGGIEVTLAERD